MAALAAPAVVRLGAATLNTADPTALMTVVEGVPPVDGFPAVAFDRFGLVITTLPADPTAADVAAVVRSPAIAANNAWNSTLSKLATAC